MSTEEASSSASTEGDTSAGSTPESSSAGGELQAESSQPGATTQEGTCTNYASV